MYYLSIYLHDLCMHPLSTEAIYVFASRAQVTFKNACELNEY